MSVSVKQENVATTPLAFEPDTFIVGIVDDSNWGRTLNDHLKGVSLETTLNY